MMARIFNRSVRFKKDGIHMIGGVYPSLNWERVLDIDETKKLLDYLRLELTCQLDNIGVFNSLLTDATRVRERDTLKRWVKEVPIMYKGIQDIQTGCGLNA